MPQMARNTLFEKMDFGKCYGGDMVQKKTVLRRLSDTEDMF